MRSRKILSLVAATALAGGVVTTTAVIIPPVVTAAETMADQYQPYFDDAVARGTSQGITILQSEEPLPSETRLMLTDFPDYGVDQNIYFQLFGDQLEFGDWGVMPSGATTTARVTVLYPDGTADIISAFLTVIPPQNTAYEFTYGWRGITPGTTGFYDPAREDLPPGITVTLINTPTLLELRELGWSVDVVEGTTLAVTAPPSAGGPQEFNLIVTYPDGTVGTTNLVIDIQPPLLNESHEIAYEEFRVLAGGALILSPLNTDFPQGTYVYGSPSPEVDEIHYLGGTINVYGDGTIEIALPFAVTEDFYIPIEVVYPDGSFDQNLIWVDVDPADQNVEFDLIFQDTMITAGTSGIIPSQNGQSLPAGTILELMEDGNLEYLRSTGWNFDVLDGLHLAVGVPADATEGTSLDAVVSYPDGTAETVGVYVWVNPLMATIQDVAYPPVVLLAGRTITITPITTGLPPGTTFTLVEDGNLEAALTAGWSFTPAANGKVIASAPETTAGAALITVLVHYPDGTSETTPVDLTAIIQPGPEDPGDPTPRTFGSSFTSS